MRETLKGLFACGCLVAAASVFAGAQQYEPLSASVRAALHQAVADAASPRLAFRDQMDGAVWLADMSTRMKRRIPDEGMRRDFLVTVHYEASRAGLDPQLVLAVVEVESKFRKYAVSRAGARGYMQVMPFWIKLIGDENHNLFALRTNLRYGCTILRHYLDIERGNVARALGRYNGSAGQMKYSERVRQALLRNWTYDAEGGGAVTRATTPAPGRGPARVYLD
jgi:soluble lytic murein transglycosylase-like protein